MDPIKEAIESLGVEQIRAAGGIVHSDGNIFFTNLDQLQSAVRAALAAQQAGVQVPQEQVHTAAWDLLCAIEAVRDARAGEENWNDLNAKDDALRAALEAACEAPSVVRSNNDVDLLLRQVFALCEATEDAPGLDPEKTPFASLDFDKGRRFEAKQIRRAIGDWFQAEFCGRSFMGEPVVAAAPEAPAQANGFGQKLMPQVSGFDRAVEFTSPTQPTQGEAPSEREALIAMVDAAMVEMKNIVPPLRRSECERLIRAALASQPQAEAVPVEFLANGTRFKMAFFDNEDDLGNPTGGTHVTCFGNFAKELDGRWVALVAAEDDQHLRLRPPTQASQPQAVDAEDAARLKTVLEVFGKREDNLPLTEPERVMLAAFDERGAWTTAMKIAAIDAARRAGGAG